MSTTEIIELINQLPINTRLEVIEKTLKSLRIHSESHQLSIAAEALYNDYKTDKDLTAFTDIDFENFYEAR